MLQLSAPRASALPRPSQAARLPSLQGYAQVAFYAHHQEALHFAMNRLTGKSQSTADKAGWVVNTHA